MSVATQAIQSLLDSLRAHSGDRYALILALEAVEQAEAKSPERVEVKGERTIVKLKEARDVSIEEVRDGVKFTVCDPQTDTLALITARAAAGEFTVRSGLRGNFDAGPRYGWKGPFRPISYSTHSIAAKPVSPEEYERRRVAAGCEPRKQYEFVGVKFKRYGSPAEAAADAAHLTYPLSERVWTYRADKALKLTIGDPVSVPVGDAHTVRVRTQIGTVVSLNRPDPTPDCGYVKDVDCRVIA